MNFSEDKISMKQAVIIFFLAIGAPSLRVIPNYMAYFAKNTAWLSAIIYLVPAFILIFVLKELVQKKQKSLYEIYEEIFGTTINKFITIFYIAWSLFLASLYLRMFGERFLGTILFDANLTAIIIFMACFVYFIVNQKIDVLGRLAEVLTPFFAFVILAVFFLIFSKIDVKNLWPITHYDMLPMLKGLIPLLSLSSYITGVMFLGDKISDIKTFGRKGNIATIVFCSGAIILILSTIGVWGYRLNLQFLFPYFVTLKNINILNTIERIESLVISVWLATDAVIISLFTLIALNLVRKLFKTNAQSQNSIWLITLIVMLAINIFSNAYDIEVFARDYGSWINIGLFMILPIIAFGIGKVRKIV